MRKRRRTEDWRVANFGLSQRRLQVGGGGGMGEGRFCNSISSYFVHDPHGSAGKARPRREDGHHEGDVGSGLVVGHQQQVLTQVPEEGIAGTSTGT